VAVSDPDGRVATPVGTVRTGAPEDLRAIARIATDRGAVRIVVGYPLRMSGETGEAADQARRFAEALRGFVGLPVDLQDERLSTVEAQRRLTGAGVRGRQQRRVVDPAAATVILQAYLDRRRSNPSNR
jgi:putative Holliday junction resolvase